MKITSLLIPALLALIAGCTAESPGNAPAPLQHVSSIASYLDSGPGHNPPSEAVTVMDMRENEDAYILGSRTIVTTRAVGGRENFTMVSTNEQAALHLISRYLHSLDYSFRDPCEGRKLASVSFGGGSSIITYDVYKNCVKKSYNQKIYYASIHPSYSQDLEYFYTKTLEATKSHRERSL